MTRDQAPARATKTPAGGAAPASGLALLLAVLTLILAVPAAASGASACAGSIHVGDPHGIELRGFGIKTTDMGCRQGRNVVRAYLRKKLNDASERCAGNAANPSGPGCRVGAFHCHATSLTGTPVTPQMCTSGQRVVRFRERDSDHG